MRRPHQRRPSKNRSRRLAAAKHTVRSGYFPPQPKANATPFPQVASLTCHVSIAYGYNVIINRSSFSLSQSFSIPSSSFFARQSSFTAPARPISLPAHSLSSFFRQQNLPFRSPILTSSPCRFCFFFLCRLYSLRQCRGAHSLSPSFHVEQKPCHPPKPQRLSGFLIVYAYLCNIFFAHFCPLSSLVAVFLCSVLFRRRCLPLASTNGFSLRDGRFAFSRATVGVPVHRFCRRRALSPFAFSSSIDCRFRFVDSTVRFCRNSLFRSRPR